ncbi:cutinase family protein [Dactylosporangium sp. CA-092794]|uniref:cutinase family protein n=1 Tax=Dactylosporangium sp. CA-092794 TaxID=3239929 RepID=UPI003D8A9CF3
MLTGVMLVGGAVTAPFASASVGGGESGTGLVQRLFSWFSGQSGQVSQPAAGAASLPTSWPTAWPQQLGVAGLGVAGLGTAPGVAATTSTPTATSTGAAPAGGADCADVEFVFARGTGDIPDLGVLGTPLASAIRSALPGRSVNAYGVQYAAEASQASAGPGATDMSRHVRTVAAACPGTKFVIGGYSQGATVTDIAIGIQFGLSTGEAIPADLAPRVAAVVVFGNPLGILHQTISERSPLYGPKTKEFCGQGDPVCGNGANSIAHLQYMTDGSVQQAAQFVATKLAGA